MHLAKEARVEMSSSPKIRRLALITSQAFSIGNFRGPLVKELVSSGVEVFAIAPDYDEVTRAIVRALGAVPVDSSMSRNGINPLRDLADLVSLTKQLKMLRVDAVFSYFIKPVIYGTFAAWLAGVPRRFAMIEGAGYVFTDQETSSRRRRILRMLVSGLYRIGLSAAHVVFMLNKDDRQLFVNDGMVSADKVSLLDGIGLDLDCFRAAPTVQEPVTFILVARLLREKGVMEYVKAARKLKPKYPSARFLLVGGVDLNPGSVTELEVRSWVDEGLVEWPGQVKDVREWLAQASVFVLPSYYREGLPRSTQEAMALARPVITTDNPGCRETVENGVNGILVPVRDSESLSAAMASFIEQPEMISNMGRESRRMAVERFNVRKINAEIIAAMGLN